MPSWPRFSRPWTERGPLMTEFGAATRLSVLIPVYNWDSGQLISALAREILAGGLTAEVEVRLFDDASQATFRDRNRVHIAAAREQGIAMAMQEAPHNVGRSAARNALVSLASGRLLLFLDADVLPDEPDFLRRYLTAADSADALCGGISYRQCGAATANERFYLRYSSNASVADAETRMQLPWAWVYTASILVARDTIARVPFDGGFVGYGYEDLEWGLRISRQGRLRHIDNTVTHLGLLSKQTLARKSSEAALNLVHLWHLHPEVARGMSLVRLSRRLSVLPSPLLVAGALAARWLFMRLPGPYGVELALFQADKVFRSALAFRRAASPRAQA